MPGSVPHDEQGEAIASDRNRRAPGIYEAFGVTPILNAAGMHTKLGGPTMNEDAARGMLEAAREAVRIDELQAGASEVIASITGTEAGYVTSGAAAGLTLATAACMCGLDVAKMNHLPHPVGIADEVVISREHRSGYDHAYRAAGARLIEVGMNEITAGAGVRRTEPWEYAAAISERTAAIAYVYNDTSAPRLDDVVGICRENGVPLIVDAAGQVPPVGNFRRIPGFGADLVVFSGGKGIRGPQGTGIVAGSRDLIMSIALQQLDLDEHWDLWEPPQALIDKSRLVGLPRHGLGRGFKVAKEEIVGLLIALRQVSAGEDEARIRACEGYVQRISEALTSIRGIRLLPTAAGPELTYPTLDIFLEDGLAVSALEAARALRLCAPPIYLGEKRLREGVLTLHPVSLDDARTDYLIERLTAVLQGS